MSSPNPKFLAALNRDDSNGAVLRQLTAGNSDAMLAARLAFELGRQSVCDDLYKTMDNKEQRTFSV